MANPSPPLPSPASLSVLVQTDFAGYCNQHNAQTGSARRANLYCFNCSSGPLCVDCTKDHQQHSIVQVYISKQQPTLRVNEFTVWPDLLDEIQCHQFSFKDHVFLTRPPRPQSKASVCEECNLKLQLSSRFCSLGCKLLFLARQERDNQHGTGTSICSENVAGMSQSIQLGLESLPGTSTHASPSSMAYQKLQFPTRQGVDQHGSDTSTHFVGLERLPGTSKSTVGLGTTEITDSNICTTRKHQARDVGTPDMSAGLGTSKVIAPDSCTRLRTTEVSDINISTRNEVSSDGLSNVHDRNSADGVGTSQGGNQGVKTMIGLSEETNPKIASLEVQNVKDTVIGIPIDPKSSTNKSSTNKQVTTLVERVARSFRPFRRFIPY